MTAEPVAVLDLTDEELAVLATTEGAVVFPHLSELPEEAQRVARWPTRCGWRRSWRGC